MKPRYSALLIVLLSSLSLGMSTGLAGKKDKKNEHNVVREALQRGEVLPLVKILAIANEQVPGDVIEVELEDEKQALVYEIKILTGTGRVREVKIDARTGKVLEIEDD
ncbi:PepSY domain-containing protein [Steroidobacter sp. S1-65]|uniref:PepSY domain-containing protein n=1 Tax=Steroidobacter gossypii TaxID=2805490 RepID=A0ABS1X4F7_9GAMM|nr:PepSY domain-containing protein [Steroidobacter gossypii]MBM0108111.1 PepSY domain-containing protein [Steroidobacter gossypii]